MQALQELLNQQAALNRQITELRLAQRAQAVARIRAILAEHGMTMADVTAAPSAARKASANIGKKVAPKYRHPALGVTWTGRGLKPKWLSEELAAGKQLADFAL